MKCDNCTEKCPQAETANEIAKGRMYATDEVIRLQKELQAYKDAEEQGLLLRLPIAEGSQVYVIDYTFDCKHNYECPLSFDKYKCEEDIRCEHECKDWYVRQAVFNHMMLGYIGKTVFLTKSEAEQALAELALNRKLEKNR